jgi:hypothetical protein
MSFASAALCSLSDRNREAQTEILLLTERHALPPPVAGPGQH